MDIVTIEGEKFRGDIIPLPHASLLLLQAKNGMLGCGSFNLETAEKLGDALAVVTGVSTYEEMLASEVRKVSSAAAALGVRVGQSGKEALLLMNH